MKTLVRNIGTLATPEGKTAHKGNQQGKICYLHDAWIMSEDGIISKIGTGECPVEADEVIDAEGKLVTPGLVDAHTHLIFGGWRNNEMDMKLKGATYLEILAAGGGIHSTVKATREASPEELCAKAGEALREMLNYGTTTCEAKSGYGLDRETEIKQLEVIRKLNEIQPVALVATFLGAHALPKEYAECREKYIDFLCTELIPEIAEKRLAEFCDVFCEEGVFTAEETRKILLAGQKHGLKSKVHADEIYPIGGSKVAGEIGAVSAEHLIVCNDEGIDALSKGNTVACLLPATSHYLNAGYAPARKMIEKNVAVAMATDFNPGTCPCLNLQLVMTLGCLKYRMTPEEVLTAVTLNAAAAIDRAEEIGTLEKGKKADMVIWKAEELSYVCYRMGSNLADRVIKEGKIVGGTR